jgi:hypothetical protein
LAPASINLQLSAIRKLATEAAENNSLDHSVAHGIVSLKCVRQSGARAENWLTRAALVTTTLARINSQLFSAR